MPNEPATKQDLSSLEDRLNGKMSEMEGRLASKQELSALEDRLNGKLSDMEDRLIEKMRDMQTEVLTAFHGWASPHRDQAAHAANDR